MKTPRIVVVGGGYAGVLCAARLARRVPHASIALISARPYFVERVRLHEDAAAPEPRPRVPLARLLQTTGVGIVTGWVRGADLEARRLHLDDGNDVAFDELIIATGSVASDAGVPGVAEHAFSVATEEDVTRLVQAMGRERHVAVVGGGLTGIELATELGERRSARVTLVTSGVVGPGLSARARSHVVSALDRLGVDRREGARVVAAEEGALVLADGTSIAADAIVWCAGFRASSLPRDLGLATDRQGRAFVDERLRSTAHDFVHVAGDAARLEQVQADGSLAPLRMACATANPMGAFCADDIARSVLGHASQPFRFAYLLQCLSLGRRDAVVMRVDTDDHPREDSWLLRRTPAVWFKEGLCRLAIGASALERHGIGYPWPQRRPALASRGLVPPVRD